MMDVLEPAASGSWGLFGRPIFEDPSARALSRVGVVDVGSNSVRMVVFNGAARSPAYFYNEKIMCALGQGLGETGHLNPEGRVRALSAIKRFQYLAEGMGTGPLTAVATAAVRDANDGADFAEQVRQETGLELHVIDGEEEARLSAQGVLLGWPEAEGIVCDLGGASMELAEVADGKVGRRVSSKIGPLKLQAIPGGRKALKLHIRSVLEELANKIGSEPKRLYLVGGSWRAIARLDMERLGYPLHVLHEYRMTPKQVRATCEWIHLSNLEEVRQRTGTSAQRMALVPIAAEILVQLVSVFKPREIAVSSYGIREGMLFEQMPEKLRKRDPLIEACRFAEAKDARFPGAGRELFHFIEPIFEKMKPRLLRIVRAACLLHDVTWRAHPDYRAEVCFDNATRANLGGLTHNERIWLGLALMHRYKNSREGSHFTDLFELLPAESIAEAEAVGKAMRFGAMFSFGNPRKFASLSWQPKKKILTLKLTADGAILFGEVAQSRFDSLVRSLGATGVVNNPS